ncbi:MAG TPA: hypothetical protein VIY48_05505 [Candidatus Paceibacterota bacterium]
MTLKDYRLIADALKRSTPLASDDDNAMRNWLWVIDQMATQLKSDNARFDRAKFIAACKGE